MNERAVSWWWLVLLPWFFWSSRVPAITLDATKINTAGVYAAGSSVPTLLRTANAIGRLASKWPVVIGMSVFDAVLRDMAGQEVHWLPSAVQPSGANYPVPAGWANANSPPANTAAIQQWRTQNSPYLYGSSPQAVITQYCATRVGVSVQGFPTATKYTGAGVYTSGTNPANGNCLYEGGGYSGATSCGGSCASTLLTTCPSGYQLVSGNCNKNEGATYGYAKWPSDNVGTVQNNGTGTWNQHARDPDPVTVRVRGRLRGKGRTNTGTRRRRRPRRARMAERITSVGHRGKMLSGPLSRLSTR